MQVEDAEEFQRDVGDVFLVEAVDTFDFRQVLWHADGELFYVVFFGVVFV